jgi:methyltransferase
MVSLRPAEVFFLALLGALACERLFELWLSARNRHRRLAAGAHEFGRGHYVLMATLHTLFLFSCAGELLAFRPVWHWTWSVAFLAMALAAQGLRYWAVASLGERWNTRVIARPGEPPVIKGPYRFVRHPNYVAVALELLSVPLIAGCWRTAVAFSLGNVALLAVRIPAEERAMGDAYREAFAHRPRFLPSLGRRT